MPVKFYLGDVVRLKKSHNCGSHDWKVLRTGIDFRIECQGCQHQAWIPRKKLEKSLKSFVSRGPECPEEEKGDDSQK